MEPLVLILLACVVIATIGITGASLMGASFFIYKAYVYYKAGGVNKEEIHYNHYDHTPNSPNIDRDDDWKNGDH